MCAPTRLCVALLIAVYCSVTGDAASEASPTVSSPAEPALIQGTLPNRLRYVVLPRKAEPGRISLRLVVHAGSLDEHDDELGYAHFVEHMAFNGTRHYPPGQLVKLFQRIGLAWGADATAETSFTSTIYKIDLPSGHASHLGEALQVLSDYAGGITFDEAEVRRERGVILSELRARDTDEWQVRVKMIAALYAGTSLPARLPIGDAALLARAEAAGLRRYYERCYRPERMTVVIVGDVAPADVAALVDKHFTPIRGHGADVAQILPSPLQMRGPQANVVTSSLTQASAVSILSIAPVGPDTIASIESAFSTAATLSAVQRRLSERQAVTSDQIGRAGAVVLAGLDDLYMHYGLEATAKPADWPLAMSFVETELRRAREQGFTAAELQEVTTSILADLRAQADRFPGKPAHEIANGIAATTAAGRAWRSPSELLAIAQNLFASFTPAKAMAQLGATFAPERLHLVLQMRDAPDGGSGAVIAAYQSSAAQPLSAPAAASDALEFRYTSFGPAGAIAERNSRAALGVERVRFANGVRLNLRPSTIEPHRFRLSARLGRGTADIPRDKPGLNYLATALLMCSDLNRHTRDDFRRLTGLHAVEGSWNFDDNDFVIELSGPSEALPFALQSLTARISDLKLEAGKLREAVALYPALLGSTYHSAQGYAQVELLFRASGEDPRCRIPSPDEFAAYPFEVVTEWLRTRWLEGPLEVGIAGDIKIDEVVTAAASSIGTLSERHETPVVESERRRFSPKPYRNLMRMVLPDQAADVRLFWPLQDSTNLRTYRAAQFANAALQDRIVAKLRQELGATYSPLASVYRSAGQPDFGLVAVEITLEPAKAIELAERTINLAREFATKGISKEEFARLREPLRVAALADLRSNEWWLANVLQRAQTQPSVLDEAETHAKAFDTITREDVNRAAKAIYLGHEASCVGVIPGPQVPAKTP